jgi:hypothetical protein
MADQVSDFDQGIAIGKQLATGHAVEAKATYDSLCVRIHTEAKADVSAEKRRIAEVERGIAQKDPTDAEKLNGADHPGYFIYWNARKVADEALKRTDDFCGQHQNCEGVGQRSNYGYDKEHQPPSPKGEKATVEDIAKFVQDTNQWLKQSLPDQLEYQAFIHDFNQKRFYPDFVADKSSEFYAIVKTTPFWHLKEYAPVE